MIPRVAAAFIVMAGGLASPALAQTRPEEQARRLLEDGRQYRAQGKTKQALDNFTTIASGFTETDSVDDALLEIGRYRMEVEGDLEKARAAFEQVTKTYPQSDGAPGAYYWLGRLTLSRATTPAELEDALAQFNRVQRLYPRSDWVPQALYASGLVYRKSGKLVDAIEIERRVSFEYPHSEAAPLAQFEIGLCYGLLGEPRLAMEEFQQVRNRFAASPAAADALDRITSLYRLYGAGRPTFAFDSSYSIGSGDMMKDVTALFMSTDRHLWLASKKSKSVFFLSPEGKVLRSHGADEPRSVTLSPKGEVVLAAQTAARIGDNIKAFQIPADKPGEMEPLEKIAATLVLPGGTVLVADEKKKRVYKYDDQFRYQGAFPDARERKVVRMLLDSEGAIVMLDDSDKALRIYDVAGRLLRTIGPKGTGFELKDPLDVAVDAFRNFYVTDGQGAVHVLNNQGQLLTTLLDVKKPRAITLEPSGALLIYDDKLQKVLRYQ